MKRKCVIINGAVEGLLTHQHKRVAVAYSVDEKIRERLSCDFRLPEKLFVALP